MSKHQQESKLSYLICEKIECLTIRNSVKYFVDETGMTVVCLSSCPRHGSEYHYKIVQKYFTNVLFLMVTHFSEDEQRLVFFSAHPPPKIPRKLPCTVT